MILISCTIVSAASTTLMSYKETGIRSRDSVNNFTLSKTTTIKINHNQKVAETFGYSSSKCKMTVNLQKKGTFFFSDTGDSMVKYGNTSGSKTLSKSKGTYRLHFESQAINSTAWPSFNISGTVKK